MFRCVDGKPLKRALGTACFALATVACSANPSLTAPGMGEQATPESPELAAVLAQSAGCADGESVFLVDADGDSWAGTSSARPAGSPVTCAAEAPDGWVSAEAVAGFDCN